MKKIYLLLFAGVLFMGSAAGQVISATTYPFTTSSGVALEDLSTGATIIVTGGQDDGASGATNIGFDFWFDGVRYTQFGASSNGYIRMGGAINGAGGAGDYTNSLAGGTQTPVIAPYWDDLVTGTNGSIRIKLIGTAPNRKLVVEWQNQQLPRPGAIGPGAATYQVWLYEKSGVIQFVYGTGMVTNTGLASIGFANSTTAYASVTLNATSTSSTATYGVGVNNSNTLAITAGTSFTFTPNIPADPTGLTFTAVDAGDMTLNWIDIATNEVGYAIYRSTDGINYTYINQAAANATTSVQTGLTQSTTYYWNVYAVTEGGVSGSVSGSQTTPVAGNVTSNGIGGGLWSATTTWAGGVVPTAGDNVTIAAGDLITEDVTAAGAYSLSVSGTLEYEATLARTLTVGTDVTINGAGTIRTPLAASTVTTHVLSVGGNLTNNGVLNLSTNTNLAGARIIFTGASNNSFSGSGATNIRTITLNKGNSSTNVLELNTANFSVQGTVIDGTPMAFLTLTNGTLKISGSFTLAGRMFTAAAYVIPATGGIWLNNPNVTVSGQNGSPTNNGLLRLTQGTYNIGSASGNSMGAGNGASYIIEGGAMNVTGRLLSNNTISYTQTAGTVTVSTIGNASNGGGAFQIGGGTFTMSGGSIVIVQRNTYATTPANRIDYAVFATPNITGGTLQFGSAATATNFDFKMEGYAPKTLVDNTGTPKTLALNTLYATSIAVIYGDLVLNNGTSFIGTTQALNGELDVVGGNVNIGTGATFNFNGALVFTTGTSIINNGTLTGTVAGSELYFAGTGAQTYSGTGVWTPDLKEMAVDNAAGVTFSSTNPVFADSMFVFTGGITGSALLNLGNGGASSVYIQIGNGTTPTAAGTFDAAPTFNAGTGGVSLFYGRTTAARNTGFEIPATRLVNTLGVDENDLTHPLTLTGGDLTVSGTYTQVNGDIITGANTLVSGTSVATPGTYTYTNGIIIGNFKRWITTTGTNWNFPVGISGAKRNASIDFTADPPTTGGTLTASWVSSPEGTNGLPLGPNAQSNNETLTQTSSEGYWSVVAADGLAGGTYTGTFTATGITAADYTRLVLIKRPDAASPWTLDGAYVTTTGSAAAPIVSRTGMSGFSEFGLAADAGLVATNLSYFRGSKQGSANYLDWKVNVTGDAVAVSLQRSTDGRNFNSIYNTNATATTALNPFNYTDASPVAGRNYYRLKMTELSGRVTYSSVVVLLSATKGTEIVSIAPTVTNGAFNLNISSVKAGTMIVMITDMSGQIVSKQMVMMIGGFNSISMDVSKLAAGTYRIFGINEDGKTNAAGFIKN